MTTILPLLAALAILPSQTRNQTRGVILLREGPGGDPAAVEAGKVDKTMFDGKARIAVLPFTDDTSPRSKDGAPDEALSGQKYGLMSTVAADLRYVPAYLVVDRSEVLTALRRTERRPNVGLVEAVGTNLFVRGVFEAQGPRLSVKLTLTRFEDGKWNPVAQGTASGPRDAIFSVADEALLTLLEAAKTTPSVDRVAEIKKVPTGSFLAKSEVDAGLALLDVMGIPGRTTDAVEKASLQALEHAKAALKADRNYLAALMLRATCLHNLGRTTELKECLEKADGKKDSAKVDVLTQLEFEGDTHTFKESKHVEAAKSYEKMLAIEPGNLLALWSLIGLYAGDHGPSELSRPSTSAARKAGEYAARLILAHPKSAAAIALSEPSAQ